MAPDCAGGRGAGRPRRRPPAAVVLAAVVASSCVHLTPFEEIRQRHGASAFVPLNGQQVYVEQQGEGEPLVLLHGFGGSSYTWRQIVPELARDYRVIAPDLSGFGYTQRPRALESYTAEGQVRLILGLLDRLGLGRTHVAGHSYGGSLSLQLASRHPDRVRSLILIDSAAADYPAHRRVLPAILKPLATLYIRTLALRPGKVARSLRGSIHDDSLITTELVEAYLDRVRVEGTPRAFWGLTRRLRDTAPAVELETLVPPTLAIWGAEDRLIEAEAARAAVARIPDSEFVVLPATGHLPPEERPAEVARLMRDFLARQSHQGPQRTAGGEKAGLTRVSGH